VIIRFYITMPMTFVMPRYDESLYFFIHPVLSAEGPYVENARA